jgi:undecaprenyl-diphosphatase
MQEINIYILNLLNWLSSNQFIQIFVGIFIDLPIFILPVFLLWFWLYYNYKFEHNIVQKEKLIFIVYWIILWLSISLIIQQIIHIDRPEEHLESWAVLLLDHLPDASFPSDHATVGMSFLFWLLFAGYKKYFFLFLIPMLFMIISRVIAWIHWPFDVLVWTFVWLFSSYLIFSYFPKIKLVKRLNIWIIRLLKYIKL